MHTDDGGADFYLPHIVYTATDETNDMFEGCATKKMINVYENQASCDGTEKSFSVVFNDLNRPDFSSFDSAENFVAGLISLNNLTLNQTINLATTSDGFQNMMLYLKIWKFQQKKQNFLQSLFKELRFPMMVKCGRVCSCTWKNINRPMPKSNV